MHQRLRLLRRTPSLRSIVRETHVSADQFIYPIFVRAGVADREPIESMPGQYRWPAGGLSQLADEVQEAGVRSVLLFGLPDAKDERASGAYAEDGVVQQAIRALKEHAPELVVMTDVCVCAYTPHGHCGILCGQEIDNDSTLPLLARMAVSHANAGADVVAPSSMMDGQVLALRNGLDEAGFHQTPVMGYSAKFASAYYGPFRDAADSAPSFGDRASYQHDAGNIRHAKLELLSDIAEGADVVMVKPGLAYLDVVRLAREVTDVPVAVYNVSGEYSMVKAAAERGWIDEKKIVLETMTAFRRAGADLIITYHALDAARWLRG